MRPLYFVTARTLAGATVWAAHLYAATSADAQALGKKMREADRPLALSLGLAYNGDVVWGARKSTSYANAMNA